MKFDDNDDNISEQRAEILDGLLNIYNNPIIKAFGHRLNCFYEENNIIEELESYNYVVEFEKIIYKISEDRTPIIIKLFINENIFSMFIEKCKEINISLTQFKNIVRNKKEINFFEKRLLVGNDEMVILNLKGYVTKISEDLYGDIQRFVSNIKC